MSSDTRPVILGMNNPHSDRPEAALLPHPRGVAGHRLWKMVNAVSAVSRADYCRRTDRRNLLNSTEWDPVEASFQGREMWPSLAGRRVIVLGSSVRAALWLPNTGLARWSVQEGVMWVYLPHPSGRSRDYNDPLVRLVAGLVIEEEMERGR